MIDGSRYRRLIAIDGKPLSRDQQADEEKKLQQVETERRSESPSDRRARIEKFQRGRLRNNEMMEQLTKAFDFKLLAQDKLRGFNVWLLAATPRPGYNPPNMASQVLPGMRGQLWIDQKTYQWVKITAQVVRPVSIDGFLAKVEPGTEFEMEKSPVEGGTWQVSRFSMKSQAKVLMMFEHDSSEDDTFFEYQKANEANRSLGARR
jgi:hypothetical protein